MEVHCAEDKLLSKRKRPSRECGIQGLINGGEYRAIVSDNHSSDGAGEIERYGANGSLEDSSGVDINGRLGG